MRTVALIPVVLAVCAGLGALAEDRYDVLVVGGTTKGVEAAKAARAEGKNVFLVTPFSYLGEDLAGTLELGFEKGRQPRTPLEERLWRNLGGLAPFDYWPDRPTDGLRWVFKNDAWNRLSEPGLPPSMSDTVLYLDDVTYRCKLRRPAKVARVEVLVVNCPGYKNPHILTAARQAALPPARQKVRHVATAGVTFTFADGPRKGETLTLTPQPKTISVPGDFCHETGTGIVYAADINAEITAGQVKIAMVPTAHHQLVSRIHFPLVDAATSLEPPSPLKVKRTYDRELLDAGVDFLTSTAVRRVVRGDKGAISAVEVVNRSGRRMLRADRVVDATRYGLLGKTPTLAGPVRFSRVMIWNGPAPELPGVTLEPIGEPFTVAHSAFDGRMYRCTFDLPMADGSYPSFAAAEWQARALTEVGAVVDAADQLVWRQPADVPVASTPTSADELPVWGEFDVVVVGGGTAGVPAALAAARGGAKTLIVEYRDMLGGVGTDGMVGGLYDGNNVGFTDEFRRAYTKDKGVTHYARSTTWNRLCREEGIMVWFGAMGLDVRKAGNRVTGVEVSTEFGTGVVKATCVIDGTGSSDIAAAAGAETELVGAREFGLQSAGQSPQRLGYGGINSDFGFLNDADARDLWLFGLRARAGAPNAWDIAKLPNSRERRRIVPDLHYSGEDLVGRRTFPDVICQALSRQDPHGYLTDEFTYLAERSTISVPSRLEAREMFNVNIPLRATLPRGVVGVAVVGLSAGIERDVLSISRMQGDLMNMGYGVGTAAALAVKKGGDFRAIDWAELRTNLVAKGVLRDETLNWRQDEDVTSDALIASAVKTLPDGYRGGHVIYRPENRDRAWPLLRTAFGQATDEKARQVYAMALGLLGDGTGADVLADLVCGRRAFVDPRAGHRGLHYGKGAVTSNGEDSARPGALLALGRTRTPQAREVLVAELAKLPPNAEFSTVRQLALGLEGLADPKAAAAIAAYLQSPGIAGYAVSGIDRLSPLGGYGVGPEMDLCLREIALARALIACGDHEGLARRTFDAYARDPRGILAAHAKAILAAYPAIR